MTRHRPETQAELQLWFDLSQKQAMQRAAARKHDQKQNIDILSWFQRFDSLLTFKSSFYINNTFLLNQSYFHQLFNGLFTEL